MNVNDKLQMIAKHSDKLMVNVTAQGMAVAEFLDSIGVHAKWVRVIGGRVCEVSHKTAPESLRG
jgi:hypothetical protein